MKKSILKSIGCAAGFVTAQILLVMLFTTIASLKAPGVMAALLKDKDLFRTFLSILSSLSVFIMDIVLLSLFFLKRNKNREPVFKPIQKTMLCKAFYCSIGIWLLSLIWSAIYTFIFGQTTQDQISVCSSDPRLTVLLIFTVCVLSPIAEELVFRYAIIKSFKTNEKAAIITSGLLFGIVHMNIFQGIPAAFMGMLFAYFFVKTDNIFLSIGMHMMFNMLGAIVQMFPDSFLAIVFTTSTLMIATCFVDFYMNKKPINTNNKIVSK